MASRNGDIHSSVPEDPCFGTSIGNSTHLSSMMMVYNRLIDEMDPMNCNIQQDISKKMIYFPSKLFCVLEMATEFGFDRIISWQTHCRSFVIHSKEVFIRNIAPRYVCTIYVSNEVRLRSEIHSYIFIVPSFVFVMARFFGMTLYASFQRQLKLYNFTVCIFLFDISNTHVAL
jgi:hypothetical protein